MSLLRRLALLLAAEGAGLVVLGLVYAGSSGEGDRAAALTAAGFAVVMGLVLLVVARAVDAGRGWARGPAVAINLFPVLLGASLIGGGVWWVGLALVAIGGLVLVLFATPELRQRFRER